LSEYVLVTGVAKEQGLAPRKLELFLDRSGVELEDIIAAVEAAKESIQADATMPARHGRVPERQALGTTTWGKFS
jgi:hypothetical protein